MKRKVFTASAAALILALLCGGIYFFGFVAKSRDTGDEVLQVSVELSIQEMPVASHNRRSVLTAVQGREVLQKVQAFQPRALDSVVQLMPTLAGSSVSVIDTDGRCMRYSVGVLPGGEAPVYLWCVGPSAEGTYARYAITQAEYDSWNNLVQDYKIRNTAALSSVAPKDWAQEKPAAIIFRCDGGPSHALIKEERKAFADFFKNRPFTDGYETDGKLYLGVPTEGFDLYYGEDCITVEVRARPCPAVVLRNDDGQVGSYYMNEADLAAYQAFLDSFRGV